MKINEMRELKPHYSLKILKNHNTTRASPAAKATSSSVSSKNLVQNIFVQCPVSIDSRSFRSE